MKSTKGLLAHQIIVPILTAGFLFASGFTTFAEDFKHLSIIQPGGVPGAPVVMGVEPVTNGVNVSWYGPSGYYRLYRSTGMKHPQWEAIGGLRLVNQTTVPMDTNNAFFRVSGPAPQYIGSQACRECHRSIHSSVAHTAHTGAFTSALFVSLGGQTNSSCLSCHSVGYGLPTGFVSKSKTPNLAGVQCENCHGPAGNHAANPDDFTVVPRVEVAATVCGGCHNTTFVPASVAEYHYPYYEDWNSSGHRAVLPELQEDFEGPLGPTVYIPSCGRCHSGTVREALLEHESLPDGYEASAVGPACFVCHDPHKMTMHTNVLNGVFTNAHSGVVITNVGLGMLYTNQIRYPFASLLDYHSSGDFATNYNPYINVCAQCHNDRDASWTSSSRPPHHSPQYNMLLGTVGVLYSGLPPNQPATHSLLEMQCVTCHMQTTNYVSPTQPAVSGHKFLVDRYDACRTCHSLPLPLVEFTRLAISNQIQQVKALLDFWATNSAPAVLRTNYGVLAWEYTNPGDLSSGGPGPSASEQSLIPVNIRKARFNVYIVLYDASYGAHNGPYAVTLLDTAQDWVESELDAPE